MAFLTASVFLRIFAFDLKKERNETMARRKPAGKLKVIPLGGIGEIGKNITAIEYGNDIVVVDCGMGFPDEQMPGIDLVIPDVSYLKKNEEKVRGIFLTHGHEDHIGAVPYILKELNVPVYATRLTLGILRNKLAEHRYENEPQLICVNAGEKVRAGCMSVEFIHVNHSIADAVCFAITTPLGVIVHSGDFKVDLTPIDGDTINLARLGQLGQDGVLLLLCESTNADRPGYTPTEKTVGQSFEQIFYSNREKRIVISTFSSNVHRVQQIIDISHRYGRKVAITGRSMLNVVSAAIELGYMNVPAGCLIDINEIKKYTPGQLTLITTGTQGESMSALSRMAFSTHDKVALGPSDLVVISASAIPGNEKLVGNVINELYKKKVTVINESVSHVHVSGHACQEELKMMHALTKPKYFMPIHGEQRHLINHKELANFMGMDDAHIFVPEIGRVLELDRDGARFAGTVNAGAVLVDGYGVGDVGNIVLRDRMHLAEDGLIVVVATIDSREKMVLSGPDVVSRGFVYVRESEELMEQIRSIAYDALEDCFARDTMDWNTIKTTVKDALSKYLYQKTKRKPMILPVIMNI